MIIVQTPLRVSLFGGGTDFPSFFLEEGGCALNFTIDKYIFVTVKQRFDNLLRIGYTQTEMVETVDQIQHELIREALRCTSIHQGVEITTMGDIPSAGSGLGSSSTVTVGALHALHTYKGALVLAETLARDACEIELDILKKPIGIQDQYIAAYGGLRFFEFTNSGDIVNQKIDPEACLLRPFNQNFMLFFTGITRQSDTILTEQKENIRDRLTILRKMKDIAYIARDELQNGNLDALGTLLHESWQLKKQLASRISNGAIDQLYDTAIRAGATGGKITGAGGGGFFLVYAPPGKQEDVRAALADLQELPFRLERDGSKVIFNYQRE